MQTSTCSLCLLWRCGENILLGQTEKNDSLCPLKGDNMVLVIFLPNCLGGLMAGFVDTNKLASSIGHLVGGRLKPICCFTFSSIIAVVVKNLKCERPMMNSLKSTSPLPSSSKMSITLLKLLGMGSRCGWTITWRGDSAAIQARTWTPNTLLQRNYTLCIRALPMMMSSFAFNDNHEQKFSYLYWSRKNPFSLSNMCSIFYHNQF